MPICCFRCQIPVQVSAYLSLPSSSSCKSKSVTVCCLCRTPASPSQWLFAASVELLQVSANLPPPSNSCNFLCLFVASAVKSPLVWPPRVRLALFMVCTVRLTSAGTPVPGKQELCLAHSENIVGQVHTIVKKLRSLTRSGWQRWWPWEICLIVVLYILKSHSCWCHLLINQKTLRIWSPGGYDF